MDRLETYKVGSLYCLMGLKHIVHGQFIMFNGLRKYKVGSFYCLINHSIQVEQLTLFDRLNYLMYIYG